MRLVPLDVLRAAAVLLVIGRHPVLEPAEAGRLRPLAGLWNRVGWSGVDLFFVLSGFLIGGLLFAELRAKGRLDVRRFLIRRAFKIWPSYYAFLAVAAVLLKYDLGGSPLKYTRSVVAALASNLVHLQNYRGTPLVHTWSLSLEEHFYLLLPAVLLAVPVRRFPLVAAAAGGGCLALRLVSPAPPAPWFVYLAPTHLRLDALTFGVLLAYVSQSHPGRWAWLGRRSGALAVLGLALLAWMPHFELDRDPIVCRAGFTLSYLGHGCLLVAALHAPGRLFAGPVARLAARVGMASYPIYLWHMDGGRRVVGAFLDRGWLAAAAPEVRWLAAMALYVGLSVVVGMTMGRLIERPALALRDRLFPPRAEPAPPDAPPVPSLVSL